MALYNNPYQYSFGVPGQMNQFQQQPVQMPAQPVQQPQQNNNGILWVSGEVGAKSYLVAPGTSVLLMDSESEKFFIKSTDVSGMPQPLRTFEYHEVGTQMPPKQPVQNMDNKYVTRQEYDDLKGKYEAIISGIITLRGLTNQCKARFFVDFSGNIAIPTGGTVGAISLAIAISGEPVLSSQMISTPAAVDQYNNVSSGIYIDVPRGCCVNIAVENTSDQAVSVANANIVVTREA